MIPSFLLEKENPECPEIQVSKGHSFIDNTIKSAATFISSTFFQWESARKEGFLQKLDSRVKVTFLFFYIFLVSITTSIAGQFVIAGLLLLLCSISKLGIYQLYKKILLIGFLFGFLIFIPASLNIFTKGRNVFTLVQFSQPHQFWIYIIPKEIAVTLEGILLVTRLTMRVINSVSITLLIVSTTSFEQLIKSLSFFKIPPIFLLTLTLTYKLVFILSNTIIETYHAVKMRWWNRGSIREAEDIVAGRIGYLFRKSWERYELVYQSMLARGFDGRMNFYFFEKLQSADYLFTTAFLILFVFLTLINYLHAWII